MYKSLYSVAVFLLIAFLATFLSGWYYSPFLLLLAVILIGVRVLGDGLFPKN